MPINRWNKCWLMRKSDYGFYDRAWLSLVKNGNARRQDRAFSGRLNQLQCYPVQPPERKIAAGKVNTHAIRMLVPFYAVTHRRPPPSSLLPQTRDVCCGDGHPNITGKADRHCPVICAAMPCAYVMPRLPIFSRWSSLHDASQSWCQCRAPVLRHDDPYRCVLNGA